MDNLLRGWRAMACRCRAVGEHFNFRWLMGTVYGVTGRVNTTIGFWLVVLVYVILGLLEVDDMAQKLRAPPNQTAARVLLDGCVATAANFRNTC